MLTLTIGAEFFELQIDLRIRMIYFRVGAFERCYRRGWKAVQ
jgi:hypothetical protein